MKSMSKSRTRQQCRLLGKNYIESMQLSDKNYQKKKRALFPEKKREENRKYYLLNHDKSLAHSRVYKALKSGRIYRSPCVKCRRKDSQAHHSDYTKPLEVLWLCPIHHKLWHEKFTAIRSLRSMEAKPKFTN